MNQDNLADNLMKQNGIDASGSAVEDRAALKRILDRDRARTRRMKWLTIAMWTLVLAAFVFFGIMEYIAKQSDPAQFGGAAPSAAGAGTGVSQVVFIALLWLAVICTVSYGIRTLLLRNRESQFRLAQLEAQLAGIQETLEKQKRED